MIELRADGKLVYNSRIDHRGLLGLKTTTGLNKGGTAEIILPPGHPSYNSFISYRTVVELYEDDELRFRGRALYPSDDFDSIRTITCEGERCFLRDGIIRPYLYQDTPAAIFADALAKYNSQVDEFKRFTLGTVDVTDPNDYVRLENSSAEDFGSFFDKLVERCGGYITFSDDANGGRAINWLTTVGELSNQPIKFGENLLEFSRSGQSPDLATALLPYGAQLEDGTRVTIESVNGGKDYIQDDRAVELRGFILVSETWDDVTDPAHLLAKARQRLNERKMAVTSLQLSTVDLHRIDRTLDTYHDGDLVPVLSEPHGMDTTFQLTERTVDWLDPSGGGVTLGKTQTSLTGADVIAAQQTSQTMRQVRQEAIKKAEEDDRKVIEKLSANVRKGFASDATDIAINAGTITFRGGTIAIDSPCFTMSEEGKIKATDAAVSTVDGSLKTELDKGSICLYGSERICGTITAKHESGDSTGGISLRIEAGGKYIMFSHPSSGEAGGYDVDYYLNYGLSIYDERHIYQTSARFLDNVYLDAYTFVRSLRLYGDDGKVYRVGVDSNGELTCVEI